MSHCYLVTSAPGIRSSGWPAWPTADTASARFAGQAGIPLPKRQNPDAGWDAECADRARYAERSRKNRTASRTGTAKAYKNRK